MPGKYSPFHLNFMTISAATSTPKLIIRVYFRAFILKVLSRGAVASSHHLVTGRGEMECRCEKDNFEDAVSGNLICCGFVGLCGDLSVIGWRLDYCSLLSLVVVC